MPKAPPIRIQPSKAAMRATRIDEIADTVKVNDALRDNKVALLEVQDEQQEEKNHSEDSNGEGDETDETDENDENKSNLDAEEDEDGHEDENNNMQIDDLADNNNPVDGENGRKRFGAHLSGNVCQSSYKRNQKVRNILYL